MSLAEQGDEQESLIYSNNSRIVYRADSTSTRASTASIGSSPSPESNSESQENQKGGLFAKLKSRTRNYSRIKVSVMSDNHSTPQIKISTAQSVPTPTRTNLKGGTSSSSSGSQTPKPNDVKANDIGYDQIVADIEAPGSPLHVNYASKDDLDLLSNRFVPMSRSSSLHEPSRATASAVNPISVPHPSSQRQITLDTDFPVAHLLVHRDRRSNSQNETDSVALHESPARTNDIDDDEDSADPIDTEMTLKFIDDANDSPVIGAMDGADEKISYDLDSELKDDEREASTVSKLSQQLSTAKRVSMRDMLNKKGSKQSVLTVRKEKRQKMKKDKSKKELFSVFQKEKKPDLSDNKNLPIRLKELLDEESTNPFFTYTLRYIEDLDQKTKQYIYEQLVNDKEFIPLICNKLLDATDAKHSEMVCIMLYDFMKEEDPNARLFAVQFIPCLVWCAMTRPPRSVSGVVAVLLSLYKKEAHIFEKLPHSEMEQSAAIDDAKDLLNSLVPKNSGGVPEKKTVSRNFGVSTDHNIFPKFEMPDLDLPSIYHEPNKSVDPPTKSTKHSNANRMKGSGGRHHVLPSVAEESSNGADESTANQSSQKAAEILQSQRKKEWKERKEILFPSLNQANLSTNLHLIFVALQVFNHYITRVSKPSLCLEQMCAVIAKLCFSGLYASATLKFPDGVTFAWDWRWYTEDLKDKQHEKYILPSAIISQFLSSIRYSLKQPATRKIAQFALGQVHRRGHIDMMPEIILQTTSMLHSAFVKGLTF